jgi:hypothetical protein
VTLSQIKHSAAHDQGPQIIILQMDPQAFFFIFAESDSGASTSKTRSMHFCRASHGFRDMLEAISLHQLEQSLINSLHDGWSLIDKSG